MGQKFTISESEKVEIKQLQEKYKKSPFYTMQSFNMGDLPDLQTNVNMRAENYTAQYEEMFDEIAKKEGRLVVKKILENLLEKFATRQPE